MHLFLKHTVAVAIGSMLSVSSALGLDLTPYRWENRLLLVFASTESDPVFVAFDRAITAELTEIEDRDLIVFRIFEKGASRLETQFLSRGAAEQLRRRFRVQPDQLTMILIGKDGGVKLVRENQADLQEVFDLIDSMPMRQQEMKEKRQNQ